MFWDSRLLKGISYLAEARNGDFEISVSEGLCRSGEARRESRRVCWGVNCAVHAVLVAQPLGDRCTRPPPGLPL